MQMNWVPNKFAMFVNRNEIFVERLLIVEYVLFGRNGAFLIVIVIVILILILTMPIAYALILIVAV